MARCTSRLDALHAYTIKTQPQIVSQEIRISCQVGTFSQLQLLYWLCSSFLRGFLKAHVGFLEPSGLASALQR